MGWIVGFVGGFAGYTFLKKATTALAAGQIGTMAVMLLLNVGCLAITVAIVAVFFKDQLMACGLSLAGSLIVFSALPSIKLMRKRKKRTEI